MEGPEKIAREVIQGVAEKVIGCAFAVQNTLGVGFVEKVYENALAHEVRKAGLKVEQQKPIHVIYDGVNVGNYECDLLVEGCVVVELKVVRAFDDVHMAQCMNYLKATGHRLCLLINFAAPRVDVRRIVMNL